MNGLCEFLGALTGAMLREAGEDYPINVVTLYGNGAMTYARFTRDDQGVNGFDAEMLAYAGDTVRATYPVHLMVMAASGRVYTKTITSPPPRLRLVEPTG